MAEHEQRADCAMAIQEALSSSKSAHHRIDALESDNKVLHEMNANIRVLALNTENLGKEVNSVKADVKELKEKPGKRWDLIVTVIITALVSGLVAVLINQIK
jgi:hypothetical protein